MNEPSTVGILDQFQTELIEVWGRVPSKLFFFVLLAAWLAVFQFLGNSTLGYIDSPSLFVWCFVIYTNRLPDGSASDDNLGLWVPFLVLGLLWWKRKELMRISFRTWSPGLALMVLGMLIHIVGYLVQQPRISILGLLVGAYGLMGLAWGPELMRQTLFPFFLLLFCIPISSVLEPVTVPLRLLVGRIVEWICHVLLGIDIIREGATLKDPGGRYAYEVAAACSGIRSLVAIGLIATVGMFVYLDRWWKRLVFLVSAAPLAVAGNVVRLLMVIVSAEIGGEAAGDYVHEGGPFGLISLMPYLPAFFGLMALGKWLMKRRGPEADAKEPKP
jgi:exosortase